MDQPSTIYPRTVPPQMTNYVNSSANPVSISNQQQQSYQVPEQPPPVQNLSATTSSFDAEASTTNINLQQQQMAAMMQAHQQWAAIGAFPPPYMMPYPPAMMMMPSQAGSDRPGSRQVSRPASRQSVTAPISSSRSLVDGQTGSQTQTLPGQGMLPMQGYPAFMPPGMFNPWFDPYWQSIYANYQNPFNFGYTDEMMKYFKQMTQVEDDRYSHHSAAYSQSKQSQHSSSLHTWGSVDSLNDPY